MCFGLDERKVNLGYAGGVMRSDFDWIVKIMMPLHGHHDGSSLQVGGILLVA